MENPISILWIFSIIYLLAPVQLRAETLEEALVNAYRNNPDLEGTRAMSEVAAEGLARAKAAYGPTLDISAEHQYVDAHLHSYTVQSHEAGFTTSAELALSQPLLSFGRIEASIDTAMAHKMAGEARLDEAAQQLISDVVSAYVALQRDIELNSVAENIYDLLLRQHEATASRFRLRDATAPDVDQIANRLELAAARVVSSRADIGVSMARYENLVGHDPGQLSALPKLPTLPPLETLYDEAEKHNPSLAISRFTEAGSRATVATARSEMRPQINAFATARRDPIVTDQNSRWRETLALGVRLNMTLYAGGQLSASLRAAKERNLADQKFLEQTRRDVREKLAADWTLLSAAMEALPRLDAAVQAAEHAVEGVKRQETAGIRTLRDVLDVTNDLLSARTAMVQARAQTYVLRVAVLKDAGLLYLDQFSIPN